MAAIDSVYFAFSLKRFRSVIFGDSAADLGYLLMAVLLASLAWRTNEQSA
jgi:hypothetical protein